MSRSVAPLENLCYLNVYRNVKDIFSVPKLGLPRTMENNLSYYFIDKKKLRFKKDIICTSVPSGLDGTVTPGFMNLLWMNDLDSWDWTVPTPLPAALFAYLMQQNLDYNSFFIESPTHFLTIRYTKSKPDTVPYDLCEPCLNRDLDFLTATYQRSKEHSVYSDNCAMMYVLEAKNWCSNCITTPLFRIFDEQTCHNRTGLHTRLRRKRFRSGMFWNSFVESDDDSDDDTFISETYTHPKLVRETA